MNFLAGEGVAFSLDAEEEWILFWLCVRLVEEGKEAVVTAGVADFYFFPIGARICPNK